MSERQTCYRPFTAGDRLLLTSKPCSANARYALSEAATPSVVLAWLCGTHKNALRHWNDLRARGWVITEVKG